MGKSSIEVENEILKADAIDYIRISPEDLLMLIRAAQKRTGLQCHLLFDCKYNHGGERCSFESVHLGPGGICTQYEKCTPGPECSFVRTDIPNIETIRDHFDPSRRKAGTAPDLHGNRSDQSGRAGAYRSEDAGTTRSNRRRKASDLSATTGSTRTAD